MQGNHDPWYCDCECPHGKQHLYENVPPSLFSLQDIVQFEIASNFMCVVEDVFVTQYTNLELAAYV